MSFLKVELCDNTTCTCDAIVRILYAMRYTCCDSTRYTSCDSTRYARHTIIRQIHIMRQQYERVMQQCEVYTPCNKQYDGDTHLVQLQYEVLTSCDSTRYTRHAVVCLSCSSNNYRPCHLPGSCGKVQTTNTHQNSKGRLEPRLYHIQSWVYNFRPVMHFLTTSRTKLLFF